MTQEIKQCQTCKKDFTIVPDDFAFYESIKVPPPVDCPQCRNQRRIAFWPFGKFNKRTCDLSGERIISIYPATTPFPVYKNAEWYSDKWQAPALAYDPARPFFEQFRELQKKVPRPHQFGTQNTACDWCDDVWESKNCYLCRSLLQCEHLFYSYRTVRCRDSYDICYSYDVEQSYDCTYCFKVFNVRYAFDVKDSMDSAFLYDCRNVRNCFMCWNLRNREYCIENRQYTKEEYEIKLKEYRLGSWEGCARARAAFEAHIKNDAMHRENLNTKCVGSTGNYLTECKGCRGTYFFENAENCCYSFRGGITSKDCHDGAGVLRCELIFDTNQVSDSYRLLFCNYCTNCRESEYLDFCFECEYCFGCVGLRKKKFCILNKEYPEAEYRRVVAEIKKQMTADGTYGRFFPYAMATSGYNLSLAGIFFPKTREEVAAMGGVWEEMESPSLEGLSVHPFEDDINKVGDDVVGQALVCEETKRAFNVIAEELAFLKRHEIPLPRYYPDVRTLKRVSRLFSIFPRSAKCHFCGKEITTYYPKEWGYERIACVECYQKEVV